MGKGTRAPEKPGRICRKILAMAAAVAMAALTACGSAGSSEAESTAVLAEETDAGQAESTNGSSTAETEYADLETYLSHNPSQMEILEAVAEANGAEIACEGNSLVMTVSVDVDEDDIELYESVYESAFEADDIQESFDELKEQMAEETGYDVSVVCRYVTAEGTEIYVATFE